MRIRWFGEPWPTAEVRAPVCDDDAYRIERPPVACVGCDAPIEDGDRGIACSAAALLSDDGWTAGHVFDVHDGDALVPAVAYHVDCWIATFVPELRRLIPRRPR